MQSVNLSEFAGGALQEKFDMAFHSVLDNLQDVNTPYKNKRVLTVKVAFLQNELRDDVAVDVSVDTKLASVAPIRTNMSTAKDLDTGKVYFEEYGRQVKGQMSMEQMETEQKAPVDNPDGQVVDFRKKAQEG